MIRLRISVVTCNNRLCITGNTLSLLVFELFRSPIFYILVLRQKDCNCLRRTKSVQPLRVRIEDGIPPAVLLHCRAYDARRIYDYAFRMNEGMAFSPSVGSSHEVLLVRPTLFLRLPSMDTFAVRLAVPPHRELASDSHSQLNGPCRVHRRKNGPPSPNGWETAL